MLKRRFGRRVAALACAVRSERSLGVLTVACSLTRWREVAASIVMAEKARHALTDVAKLMRTAAEGRTRTHSALTLG